eukprot:1476149-Rhodomonas_salina.2
MPARMAALVETMKQEMDRQARAMTALTATVARLTDRQQTLEGTEQPEVEEVPPPPSSAADDLRPTKVSRGNGMANVADAFVQALEERLDTRGSGNGEEQVADTHTLWQIARTQPASVQPRDHNNNPHTLGMLVLRAVSFEFAPEQGIAAVTWHVTQETKESEIHAQIHTRASEAAYAEGEAEFYEHIAHLLNLASK